MMNGQLLSNARERFQFAKQSLEAAQNVKERLEQVRFSDNAPDHALSERQDCLDAATRLVEFLENWTNIEMERLN